MKSSTLLKLFRIPARLPLGVLYGISDIAAAVLYGVVRYRRRLVRDNLSTAFPDADPRQLRRIGRDFYRNFTDNFIETLKLLHISDEEMARRMQFENTEIIDDLLKSGRSIVVYFGHFFNWEWAPSVSLHTALKPSDTTVFAQIYRPLRSKAFDGLMLALRSRFHSESIDKSRALRRLLELKRAGVVSITGFMSDQHPSHGDPGHYFELMNHPTMMISGTETLARRLDMAVIYWDMEKISRGHYRITTRLITDDPASLSPGEITRRYAAMLQDTIKRNPAIWLWSHNRWKHPVNPPQS